MKTPREILFKKHEAVEPKLDAVRKQAMAGISRRPGNERDQVRATFSLRGLVLSLRWHLVGMSAIWLFILFLKMDAGQPRGIVASIPPAKIPSPRVILTSLRENRRQLSEMIGNESRDAEVQKLFLLRPRSELQHEVFTA